MLTLLVDKCNHSVNDFFILGAGESGKSTFVKQMKLVQFPVFSILPDLWYLHACTIDLIMDIFARRSNNDK